MQTEDHDLIEAFAAIAREAAHMGQHSFSAWVAEPEKYLKRGRYSLPIDAVLRSVPESDRNNVAEIVGFFSRMAVRYFVAALEEGKTVTPSSFPYTTKNPGKKHR